MIEDDLIIRVSHDTIGLLDWTEMRILVQLARGGMLGDSTIIDQFQEIMKDYLWKRIMNT